ncbi:hypothetical protein GRI34_02855 [Erythrobacter aquimaris]|uniref:Uncharacterized protein n=1 Tax=Qipengyuania aquimaris TaxID=255984 RepID=A0A6I4TJE3_9SPHN|nr:hypothetical protein [Qipengyuania aquimaris]MXO95359.1 hypothetical protein [Qipengyuania aquimaris]
MTTAICLFVQPQSALAQDEGEKLTRSLTITTAKWGIDLLVAAHDSIDDPEYIPPVDTGSTGEVMKRVVDNFNRQKLSLEGPITVKEATVEAVADAGLALAIYSTGGSALVPATIIRAGIQAGSDKYFAAERAEVDQQLRSYLAAKEESIIAETGLSYPELRKLPPAALRAKLEEGTAAFGAIEENVADPLLQETSKRLIVSTIINTQKSTLDLVDENTFQIAQLQSGLGELNSKFDQYRQITDAVLSEHDKRITGLEESARLLESSIAQLDSRVAMNSDSIGLIQDLMFSKLSSVEKVEALKGGFLAHRYYCPSDAEACEKEAVKADLISHFEAQAEFEANIKAAGNLIDDTKQVIGIAEALGVETGKAGEIVQFGSVALSAFTSYATGDYLGVVSSITGAFAKKKPDPQLAMLRQMDAKLTQILRNQQALSNQMKSISERVDIHFDKLNERFDTVEFGIDRIGRLAATALNEDWRSCPKLYEHALDPANAAAFGFNPSTGRFPSFDKASQFAFNFNYDAEACGQKMDNTLGQFSSQSWFINFLTKEIDVKAENYVLKELAENQAASWKLNADYIRASGISSAEAMFSYSRPAQSFDQLENRIDGLRGLGACAEDRKIEMVALERLVCVKLPIAEQNVPEATANLLRVPMSASHARDVIKWALLEHNLANFSQFADQDNPVSLADVLEDPRIAPMSRSEQRLEDALTTLDVAIANLAMPVGDLTILSIARALTDPPADTGKASEQTKVVRELLLRRKILARNVATFLVRERMGLYDGENPSGVEPDRGAYAAALNFAKSTKEGDPLILLNTLLGPKSVLRKSEDGLVFIELLPGGEKADAVLVELPGPALVFSGEIIYTNDIYELSKLRSLVVDRLMNFKALKGLSMDDREHFSINAIRASQGSEQ